MRSRVDAGDGEKGGVVRRFVLVLAVFGLFSVPLESQLSQNPAAGGRLIRAYFADGRAGDDSRASRRLTGIVVDAAGRPVAGAVVYLENKRNLALYTYIAGEDGSYHFNNLSPDVDYDVYAEAHGRRSGVKTLSSFDSHKRPRIDLKLNKKK
jgi:hypothetical protein